MLEILLLSNVRVVIAPNMNVVRNDIKGISVKIGLTYASTTFPRVLILMNLLFFTVQMRITQEFPAREKTAKTLTALFKIVRRT